MLDGFRPTGTGSRATTTMRRPSPRLGPARGRALDYRLDAVRKHNLIAFRQAWKRFEEAVPGSLRLVPQQELREAIERGYRAMNDMILGDAPEFGWVVEQLQRMETVVNRT